jgi:mitogen-activated protein kinase 15
MNKYYDDILREIYFYACCNKNKYFNETLDVFLSEDGRYLFLILKNEGIDLKNVINFINNTGNIIHVKYIIFQVVKGLRILHKNNLSHNDLKPSNIIITDKGNAKIWGFHLTSKVSTIRYSGINGYYSPQALLGKPRTKEDDMWSVGVIYLELVKKRMGIFQIPINGPIYGNGKEKRTILYGT